MSDHREEANSISGGFIEGGLMGSAYICWRCVTCALLIAFLLLTFAFFYLR